MLPHWILFERAPTFISLPGSQRSEELQAAPWQAENRHGLQCEPGGAVLLRCFSLLHKAGRASADRTNAGTAADRAAARVERASKAAAAAAVARTGPAKSSLAVLERAKLRLAEGGRRFFPRGYGVAGVGGYGLAGDLAAESGFGLGPELAGARPPSAGLAADLAQEEALGRGRSRTAPPSRPGGAGFFGLEARPEGELAAPPLRPQLAQAHPGGYGLEDELRPTRDAEARSFAPSPRPGGARAATAAGRDAAGGLLPAARAEPIRLAGRAPAAGFGLGAELG